LREQQQQQEKEERTQLLWLTVSLVHTTVS